MKISSGEIREKFLNFFEKNDHLIIQGSSVIPKNDPTLLYINAGMAAIKNYFTGEEVPENPQLCNIQSCIRTIDIDDIGDRHHLTSFQMLGSWSIGAYFKDKAISLAFDFLVNHLNIPISKLYVSVFAGEPSINLPFDNESKNSWIRVGIPENHIVSFGMDDNFWGPAGNTGPCGPCTEVFYDTGIGQEYVQGGFFDTKRYVEIWNAGVFMMLNKSADGSFSTLPFKSVDTGAGLERLCMTLNGLGTVYDTDLLLPIKDFIETIFYFDKDHERNVRILTDHLRTICLILSEGQKISNEGRGYIPRKLIRKCIVIANKNKKSKDFDLSPIVEFILDNFKNINDKFATNREYVISEFNKEQSKFADVVNVGLEKLNSLSTDFISGELAFNLVTTFGIPFDFICDFAKEHSIKIDNQKFNEMIENHKKISKSENNSENNNKIIFEKLPDVSKTEFVGYDRLESNSKIVKIFSERGKEINNCGAGDDIVLVLDITPIYARCGGQESDKGIIFNDSFYARVSYAEKKYGIVLHYCSVEKGNASIGDNIRIEVNKERRTCMSNAHSATHLLQTALKKVFGKDVHQQGSKLGENSLHFDFNYSDKITRENICNIESIVNNLICLNIKSSVEELSLNDAIKKGAIALFSEKYGPTVRMVSFGEVSKELCGGTHVPRTGQIGTFIISSCESVGKGIKRISAFTSSKAINYVQNIITKSLQSSELLRTKIDNLPNEILLRLSSSQKKPKVTKELDLSNLKFLNTKIPFAYYIFDEEFSNGLVKDIANNIKGVFLAISSSKSRFSISVCKKLDLSAKDIFNKIAQDISAKGGGNLEIVSGGSNLNANEIIKCFKKRFENEL